MSILADFEKLEPYFIDKRFDYLMVGRQVKPIICANISIALIQLGFQKERARTYSKKLSKSVYNFQREYNHINQDGIFGPLTRKLLVNVILDYFGVEFYDKLIDPPIFQSSKNESLGEIEKRLRSIDDWYTKNGIEVFFDKKRFEEYLNDLKSKPMHLIADDLNISINLKRSADSNEVNAQISIEDLKQKITELLSQNKLDDAIALFMDNSDAFRQYFDRFAHLVAKISEFKLIENDFTLGVINYEDRVLKRGEFIRAFLHILEQW